MVTPANAWGPVDRSSSPGRRLASVTANSSRWAPSACTASSSCTGIGWSAAVVCTPAGTVSTAGPASTISGPWRGTHRGPHPSGPLNALRMRNRLGAGPGGGDTVVPPPPSSCLAVTPAAAAPASASRPARV